LVLADPAAGLPNLKPLVPKHEFDERLAVLEKLEKSFDEAYRSTTSLTHRTMIARTARLIRSDKAQAFDLNRERDAAREAYGDTPFGRGCLLARRLVETGVPFVEVYLANWDTHERNVAEASRGLMAQVDRGMGALIRELKDRGLFDSTLIVWMGEFGRTPYVNRNGGRDHFSRAWSTALAGCGVKGGQAVGRTDATGASVTDRPISAQDFMATICRALGIDYTKTVQTPSGRPIRLVEKEGKPLAELFGTL
jgi:uncharacterized protein (DUF1501 family)